MKKIRINIEGKAMGVTCGTISAEEVSRLKRLEKEGNEKALEDFFYCCAFR